MVSPQIWTLKKFSRWNEGKWNSFEDTINSFDKTDLTLCIVGDAAIVKLSNVTLDVIPLIAGSKKIKGLSKGTNLMIYLNYGASSRKFIVKFAKSDTQGVTAIKNCHSCVNFLNNFFYIQVNEEEVSNCLPATDMSDFDMTPFVWNREDGNNLKEPDLSLYDEQSSLLKDAIQAAIAQPGFLHMCDQIDGFLTEWTSFF